MGLKKQKGSGFVDCCRQTDSENEAAAFADAIEAFAKKNYGVMIQPESQLRGANKFHAARKVRSAEAEGVWEVKISRWSPNKPFSIYVKAEYRFGELEGIDAFEAETGIDLDKIGSAWSGKYTLMP